tara:strand:- start:477 stop:1106 length:630 start_codon:yes stop_codon:yes gene_type:complete
VKTILAATVLFIFFSSNLNAGVKTGYKFGKGPLKLSKHVANELEYYFSGGKKGAYAQKQKTAWKPGLIAISIDGNTSYFFRHPLHVTEIDKKNYAGIAISNCKKKSGKECFLFANAYRIVWDNGTDKKKRKLKRKDIKAGKTIALLTQLDFYDPITLNVKTDNKNEDKQINKTAKDENIVEKLKDLKELLDSGAITEKEFVKAKNKLLN